MNWTKFLLLAPFFLLQSYFGSGQKIFTYSTLSNTYTGEGNQQISINKQVCDKQGNSYLLLKVLGKLTVQSTAIPDLLNDKTKAPSNQVVKISSSGEFQWGITTNNTIADIACDSTGNLYFSSVDLSETKNNKLIFYQSKSILMTENSNNLLVKFSADGNYLWSKKILDFYFPRSVLRVGKDNKLYYLISKNGTRMMDHALICMDLNGHEEWRTDIVNLYIDVFEPGPDGKSYIAGYDYKVDEKKIVVYPFEISRYVLLEIDESGNLKKAFDKKFNYDTESKIRHDFYMNKISFDTANNPLFIFTTLIGPETPELNIANKKYKKNDGEFLFVQMNKKGEIIWDYQLKTATNIGNKAVVTEGSLGLKKSYGMTYTKNDSWLICLPTATSIAFKGKKYELLNKTDLIYFELEPKENGNINWISTVQTGKLFQSSPEIIEMNDSIFIISTLSNKTKPNVQGAYWNVAKLEVKIKKKQQVIEETEIESETIEDTVEQIKNPDINEEITEESDSLDTQDSTQADSAANEIVEENTEEIVEKDKNNDEEITDDTSIPVDSSSTEIIEETTDTTEITNETVVDSAVKEPVVAPVDIHALRVQLIPLPNGQKMLLEINKVPEDTLKESRMVEIEIRDANGNNLFPDDKPIEMYNNKYQHVIEIAKWPRGTYSILINVGGKDNAEMKIVKI